MTDDQLEQALHISPEKASARMEGEILKCMGRMNRDRIVFGMSGGLDSAVVASLARRVIDPKSILALIMPDKEGDKENTRDAIAFARELGIRHKVIYLDPYLESAHVRFPVPFLSYRMKARLVRIFYRKLKQRTGETPFQTILKGGSDNPFSTYLNKGTANYRFKHRLRLTFLYQAAEETNALVVGAANKTEYMTGFFVKFGIDHHADVMPLLNIYKTQVYELASWLNIPDYMINKPPSPDMIPGITDEFAFEIPYIELDMLLYALENNITAEGELGEKTGYVRSLYERSEHMRTIYVPGYSNHE